MIDKSIFYRAAAFMAGAVVFAGACAGASFAQTLTVTAPNPAVTIHPGDTNVPLAVSLGPSSYAGPVSVTLTGLPSGVSVAPLTLIPGSSGTLLISATVTADQEGFPANLPENPDTSTTTVTLLAFADSLSALDPVALTVSLENPSFAPASGKINLPIVSINTNCVGIFDKTTDVPGTLTITSADGQTSYLPGSIGADNTATFHLHGNSTVLMPKKPLHIKLNTSADLLHGMGLNCGYVTSSGAAVCDKSKSYILLANYDDKTLLRDWAASALANAIPNGGNYLSSAAGSPSPSGTSTILPWAPHSLFVELYLNGQYMGNYQLIEEIKVDSHRVNINEMDATDISGKSLTGGYLMQIDDHFAEDFVFVTPENVAVGLEDPDFTPEIAEQTSYIQNYVDTAEAALFSPGYTDPATGWRAYFDEAAAVNYYIVNDLMGNVDAATFYSSVYLYKDKNNPLLYMGPAWDFDLSSGNSYFGSPIVDPTIPWMQNQSPWYLQWFSDPEFKAEAKQQWNALKSAGVLDNWLASISTQAATLEQSQQNNFGRWPMQGVYVWGNSQVAGSYDNEVSYMMDWLHLRMGYIDGFLNNKSASATSLSVKTSSGPLRAGSPAVLTAAITGDSPSGRVTFSRNSIVIGSGALDGTGVATFTTSNLPAGTYELQAIYNGDDSNGISEAPQVPVTVLPALFPTAVNLEGSVLNSEHGDSLTLTATVVAEAGTAIPSGSVDFSANGSVIGSATLSATGVANLVTSALPTGNAQVQALYDGDVNDQQATSNVLTIPVGAVAPHLVIGTIPDHVFGDSPFTVLATSDSNGAISYSVASGPAIATGNTITLTGAGIVTLIANQAADGDYLTAGAQTSFAVAKQGSKVAVTSSSLSIVPGASVTLTATVTPSVSGTVTGSVTFLSDGQPLGPAVALAQGVATYSTAALLSGSHAITASYSGDNNFEASTTTGPSITVAPLDFSFTVTGAATQTLSSGSSATFTFQATALYGHYPGQVNFAVIGLPPGATASFTPATLDADAGPQTVSLTIQSATQTAVGKFGPNLAPFALAFLLLPMIGTRRLRRSDGRIGNIALSALVFLAGSTVALVLSGCGSGQPKTESYPLTVTAMSGTSQHTSVVTVAIPR